MTIHLNNETNISDREVLMFITTLSDGKKNQSIDLNFNDEAYILQREGNIYTMKRK